jgi:hypothetical protein
LSSRKIYHTPLPTEIHELGDEAYWMSNLSEALYVLKGKAFLRISLGEKIERHTERLNKLEQLARAAFPRLS